ncbi:hypothetical protein Ahy_B02g058508 [Arachis hypogaea]|uniref:Aminotransferase-like plant mobile domain-containing protein n=1 Tax=Arachis hypogaea TaxID=3818 RepID=A0A445AER7_ARAHY|nr:hypothetical protein Ahy_B02g058508 [Arachis hypogaea]
MEFYSILRVGQIRGHSPVLSALVERWRSKTHSLVLSTVEVVTGWIDNSQDFLINQSIAIFGSEPVVCHIRDTQPLDIWKSVQRYVRCRILYLLGTTLFAEKSTMYAHVKYLPLLQNFEQISTYSWGSATLAHLYRVLCRTLRWSHHPRTRVWVSRSAVSIRHDIDYMKEYY